MSDQDETADDRDQGAASGADEPRSADNPSFDMKKWMAAMMERCPCAPGMMSRMTDMASGRPPKPAQRESIDQD